MASAGTIRPQVSGRVAAPKLAESGLPRDELKQVWDLADVDKDGSVSTVAGA